MVVIRFSSQQLRFEMPQTKIKKITRKRHFVECAKNGNQARLCRATVHGKPRKCCRFCIRIPSNVILHALCCDNERHGHNIHDFDDLDHGPTMLSQADEIDNRDGYGKNHPITTVDIAKDLVKKLRLSETL